MASDISTRVIATSALLLMSAAADTVTLANGGARLSGSVRSIDDQGRVELTSELSPEPLFLKGETVDRIEFTHREPATTLPGSVLELANGDILPVIIESIDAAHLIVVSPDTGRLDIPRHAVKSIQMGVRPRKQIYRGPNNLEEWLARGNDAKNWSFERGALISNGPATAARDMGLPRQFTLRLTLAWQASQVPNIQVYFADPLLAKGEAADRYYLQFGGAGLEIKREAAKGKRYNTITILNRTHLQYPEHKLEVEIRVNRDTARMELLLNGESEGVYADPIPNIPTGTGVALVCNTSNGVSQEIRDIEVLEFDDSRQRHHAEDRGPTDSDSLITREDDRWSGTLIEAKPAGGELTFFFKSGFQDKPMEIPAKDVSTVFLASDQSTQPAKAAAPFRLRLPGDGSLAVSSCRFNNEEATAEHSLLGTLTLRPGSITAIERATTPPPAEP